MMNLKVCSWNAHSLDLAKEAYLFNYVIDEKIDVCGVCETWKDYNTSNYAGFMCLVCLLYVTDVDLRFFLV